MTGTGITNNTRWTTRTQEDEKIIKSQKHHNKISNGWSHQLHIVGENFTHIQNRVWCLLKAITSSRPKAETQK